MRVQPQLLKDFKGYSLVAFGQMYFGVPKNVGAIRLEDVDHRMIPGIIVKTSLSEVEDAVTEKWVRGLDGNEPHLVRSIHGYSVVAYRGVFFGVPTSLGDVRLEETNLDDVSAILSRFTLEEIVDEISDRWARSIADKFPRLVSHYGAFNIVFFNDSYFGVPREWGGIRLEIGDAANRSGLIRDRTLRGVKAQVRGLGGKSVFSGVRTWIAFVVSRVKVRKR